MRHWAPVTIILMLVSTAVAAAEDLVEFNRDILPLLSEACYGCHGPDKKSRKADFRLDLLDDAVADRGGYAAIVPGQPADSELFQRITEEDPSLRMPPVDSGHVLSGGQIDRIRRWIEQGAPYAPWWSLVTPQQPRPPAWNQPDVWPRNPVDNFVLFRLQTEGLQPTAEAKKTTLIRRATLDLTGLPPTPSEVEAFLADGSPDAYDRLIDRLLCSPRYGEQMAVAWLDAARYADTNGFEVDNAREMWAWRDWVIKAFNRNMHFDQFTIEQLAGDLLADATLDQKIATGFNRNHRINNEGGVIPEEFRVEYVVDRLDTTSTVWMGLTVACARCHDHKYDPISQREFYGLFSFFNNVPEKGKDGGSGNAIPFIPVAAKVQEQLDELDRKLVAARKEAGDAQTDAIKELVKKQEQLIKDSSTSMVMQEMEQPRGAFVLVRGEYEKYGESVLPDVPGSLPPLTSDLPRNRLGLARWLVDPSHPLTARVTVNRFWQHFFSAGIVPTAEDFGTQGLLPSHPQLLDWLATEFQRGDWNVKRMQRIIVNSSTYRQSSTVSPELLARDPNNRLLARGPRFRLPAEMIRDQALAISGLLSERIGGPSVKPYQPPGLWEEVAYGGNYTAQKYEQDHGTNLYRRSLYTFWKRAVPPPSLAAFDAPSRETCTVSRARTNTPLQALILLNDPTFVEAARVMAQRVLIEGGETADDRIRFAFRRATSRLPNQAELTLIADGLAEHLDQFAADQEAARQLVSVGEFPVDERLDAAELAAYTTMCSMILNLDECVVKE